MVDLLRGRFDADDTIILATSKHGSYQNSKAEQWLLRFADMLHVR